MRNYVSCFSCSAVFRYVCLLQVSECGGIDKVKWSSIAEKLPGRIGKQCRERWFNHLDPLIRKGDWDESEDVVLYEAQKQFGNRWCDIADEMGNSENWKSDPFLKLEDWNI